MKFKLDENFGERTLRLFREYQHDVETVHSEKLSGCSDKELFNVCVRESRGLITLDLDFADVLSFPPAQSAGIAVIRPSHNPSLQLLEQMVGAFLNALRSETFSGLLWIVETNRIRVHQP
jgi:predicted nuclease of predicted toxin-antitoxin system